MGIEAVIKKLSLCINTDSKLAILLIIILVQSAQLQRVDNSIRSA